jgi:uncharacterized repeat protein (TIGR03803 family)
MEESIMKNILRHLNWISRMRLATASAALALTVVLVLAVSMTQSAQAQTFTSLASFNGTNGSYPLAQLVQATDGNLYGTTDQAADSSGYGSVFEVTTSGTLTLLYTFCPDGPPPNEFCQDGDDPVAGLVQATNGDLYGTTEFGGPKGAHGNTFGTVYEITTPSDTFKTLYGFPIANGCGPEPTAGLMQASNGDLYGTTVCGGAFGSGSVFKITKLTEASTPTTLYSFCGAPSCGMDQPTDADGFGPVAGLIQASNGDLYGTTTGGGANRGNQVNGGTVFKITPGGVLTTLYSFCAQTNCTDGLNPIGPLVQASNGNFYGMTVYGGATTNCIVGCGTIFQITPAGVLTTLYNFCSQANCADGVPGGYPTALIQGTDGNLYGVTADGGNDNNGASNCPLSYGCGTIFQITTGGTLTTLYSLCSQSGCVDGFSPQGGLVQDTDGTFYGTTSIGGATGFGNSGTVFSLSTGLGPFIETQPRSGKVAEAVNILGTNLTGATGVAFNGTPQLTFTVVSGSEITTTVPTGATSGYVTVTTPGGTLTSNVPFLLGTTLTTTTTTLTSSLNPSTVGEPVTFTATVSANVGAPPNGETVSFQKGATVLGTGALSGGSASFTTSTLPVGTTSVKAVYGGDAYFHSDTSTAVRQVVVH